MYLTLHIQCRTTDEYIRFTYRFATPPVHEVPAFINQSVNVMGGSADDYGLILRRAVFDRASSTIHFSYRPNPRGGISINPQAEGTFVSLFDLSTSYNPLTNENAAVHFDDFGTLIGSATFGPVLSLESTVFAAFNGLTYSYINPVIKVMPEQIYERSRNVTAEQRAEYSRRVPQPVHTEPYTLFFEKMTEQGAFLVLTLHGVDENNSRRQVNLDMILRIDTGNGFIDIPGDTRVAPPGPNTGTDVLFDISAHWSRINHVNISEYSFIVNRVDYDVPSVRVPINISQFYNMPGTRRHEAETSIVESFLGMLAHKSGELARGSIVGLSSEIRESSVIDDFFAPAQLYSLPMYVASVSTGDLITNYDYVGIVEVVWASGENEGPNMQFMHEVFQITARSEHGIWAITEIVKI
jgi:hypothetical protein